MKYDFETLVNRMEQGSGKWAGMRTKKPDVSESAVPFSTADMEFKNAPEIIEGLKEYLDTHVLGYTGPVPAYFESVKGWMKKRHNWDIETDWIIPTPGVVPALGWGVAAFCKPGDGVIVMPPVYGPFYMSITNNGCEIVRCNLLHENDEYKIDFELFEKLASDPKNTMLMWCSPHNPVGRVWTKEELAKLGAICHKYGVKILSDEIHFDLIMPGYTHTVFSNAVEEGAEDIIVCTAPSKTFNLAAMSTSNIIIPKEEDREAFKKAMGRGGATVLGMAACQAAYDHAAPWLDACIEVINDNYHLVEKFVAERLPELKVAKMEGTYLVWIDCTSLGKNAEELEALMIEHELFFNQGTFFGPEGEGWVRFNVAAPTWVVQAGLEKLEKAVKSCK